MQIISTFDQLPDALAGRPSCVTIGVFDGVHLGHQALVTKAVEVANSNAQIPIAITFTNHPLSVLAPPYTPRRLLTPARKAHLLYSLGIEIVVMTEFTREFASIEATEFISDCLVKKANIGNVVCGYDFTFGCQGSGNLQSLKRAGAEAAFSVSSVPAVSYENHPVKSTHVRDLLSGGFVSEAAVLLTRPHEIPGIVGSGAQRGRSIGFPTANLQVAENYQLPAGGVYLCGARIGIETTISPAMVNLGTSPTFGENSQTMEAHILDFNSDIHGRPLSLFFLSRLRDEQKFAGVDELVEQLHKDREGVRSLWTSDRVRQLLQKVPGPVDHQLK